MLSGSTSLDWIIKFFELFKIALEKKISRILVDVSAFPKDRMWCILDCIRRASSDIKIFILYTEPLQYNSEVNNDGWLTRGVQSISPIHGFNGYQNTTLKALLILIIGHEHERAHITIKNIEPQKIILLGQGVGQYRIESPRVADSVLTQIGGEYEEILDLTYDIAIDSRDYIQTRKSINAIVKNYNSEFNIAVATYGTKLQSLGAMLACQENRSLRAIYAEPQKYNVAKYSSGTGKTWMLQI